jgi:hypothetical protein
MIFNVSGNRIEVDVEAVIIAGFTGRDQLKVQAHVAELAAEGITVPERVPSFYLAPASALVQENEIVTTHEQTSGEAEIALIFDQGDVYVTTASDHTDRAAETLDIAVSKLACPKIIASEAWRIEDVRDQWDKLLLRSWISENGHRVLYQEGSAGDLLSPDDLLKMTPFNRRPDSFVLLTGTLPAIGGIRGSGQFWAELHDPVTRRTIQFDYMIRVIADVLEIPL